MSRQFFISNFFCTCFLLLFFFFSAINIVDAEEAQRIKGPIIITSEKLVTDNKTNTALFEKSVVARTSDLTMYAENMLVHYDKDSGNVTRIDASGGVKLIKGDRIITSREASYFAEGEKVIFTGEPRAVKNKHVVTGRKMTYFMREDRFLVEDSKVFLKHKKEQ